MHNVLQIKCGVIISYFATPLKPLYFALSSLFESFLSPIRFFLDDDRGEDFLDDLREDGVAEALELLDAVLFALDDARDGRLVRPLAMSGRSSQSGS